MRKALITIGLAAMFALGIATAAMPSRGDHGSPRKGHVGICHHTGHSRAHEFIYITPDASGVFDGHGKLKHQFGDDIIPAFSFVNAHGQTLSFGGLNLTTLYHGVTGAVLLANKCRRPGTGTTTGHTTTGHTTTGHTTTMGTTTGATTTSSTTTGATTTGATTTGATTTGATTTGATTTGATTTGATTTGATTTLVTTVVTTTPGGISTVTVTLPASTVTLPSQTITNGSTVTVVKKAPPKVKPKAKKKPPKHKKKPKTTSHKSPKHLTG